MYFGFFLLLEARDQDVKGPKKAESKKGVYQIGRSRFFIHKIWNSLQESKFSLNCEFYTLNGQFFRCKT